MSAEEILRPTVILRPDDSGIGVVTAGEGEREALIVFRGPEDAHGFRTEAGKYTAAEGFLLVGMGHEALASLIDLLGVRLVAVPGSPYTGGAEGGVDAFDAAGFVSALEESERRRRRR